MPWCFICKVNCHLDNLEDHFINYHHYGFQQLYKCIEPLCSSTFNNFGLLRRHYVAEHRFSRVTSTASHSSDNENKTTKISMARVSKFLHEKLSNDIITMYGALDLSKQQVQSWFEITQELISSGLDVMIDELEIVHGHDSNIAKIQSDVKSLCNAFKTSFSEFQTEHKRMNVIEKTGNLILPQEYSVGKKIQLKNHETDDNVVSRAIDCTACFFPLRNVFKKIFEIRNVYETVFNYKQKLESETGLVTGFVQSKLWREITKNFHSKQVLPLFLYFDDFEAGNPLGSHAGANKMGGTYVSIPCFPPQYQSSLSSIFHALLFYSKDRERFGNFAIFRPLIEELKHLESQGIELELPQGKTTIYFKLGLILGDNLGLHSLFGLVECFRANYCCRFCRMDTQQRSLATLEDKYFLRNKINYERDLARSDVGSTGIKQACVFHVLPDFHITTNMAVDIMHDLIEGVCFTDMAAIIKRYIDEGLFTLTELNNRVKNHDFGQVDSDNVPPKISPENLKNDNIKMSASEMWTFVRHFGIIIGDLVPEDDEIWPLYLNLRQLLAFVTSNTTQKDSSSLLKNLIREHHWLARYVLKRDFKATDHHLIHYPSVLDSSGPLINFWSMRFEAFHRPSKILSVLSNTKKNLCKTLSMKHQLKLTHMIHFNTLFSHSLNFGPARSCQIKDLLISFKKSLNKNGYSSNSFINVYNWVKNAGNKYQPEMILTIGEGDNGRRFGLIKFCCTDEKNTLFFICEELITVYNYHTDAYEILEVTNKHAIIIYDNLFDTRPIGLIRKNDRNFILLRYN